MYKHVTSETISMAFHLINIFNLLLTVMGTEMFSNFAHSVITAP